MPDVQNPQGGELLDAKVDKFSLFRVQFEDSSPTYCVDNKHHHF